MNLTECWAHYKYPVTVCCHTYYDLLPAILSSSMYHQAAPSSPALGRTLATFNQFPKVFSLSLLWPSID